MEGAKIRAIQKKKHRGKMKRLKANKNFENKIPLGLLENMDN
jgi:hypothetical protein